MNTKHVSRCVTAWLGGCLGLLLLAGSPASAGGDLSLADRHRLDEFAKRIYGLLRFANFFRFDGGWVRERSCVHISGLWLRHSSPQALMDFRVFSSQSSYRPDRPMR